MTLSELRLQFPHTERGIYLNHAATGPLSRPVMAAINRYLEQRHLTKIENYFDFAPVVESARARVARLIGASEDRVEFAPNTSYGLNILAGGLDWKPGDRIAVAACEFPANVYPFMNLQRHGVEVDFIPDRDGVVSLEDVARALRPETRLLTISWVQFLSGFRADLAAVGALCKERGVLFCVDAIQGLGAIRLDVAACGIDFLACGAHKWIMADAGIGFIYLTSELQDRITPAAGWLHGPVDWEDMFDYRLEFHPDASRFRLGTMNSAGIASLNAALELYESAGPEWCEQQVLSRSEQLAAGLDELELPRYGSSDPAHRSGIVTVRHESAAELHGHLVGSGIEAVVRQGMLRFSPTYYNSPEEIEQVLEAVEHFIQTPVRK